MRYLPFMICAALLATAAASAQEAPAEECRKGIFWPFVREAGDCLTDAAKRNGATENAVEATIGEATASQVTEGESTPVQATAVTAPAARCSFWVFVSEGGACPTDAAAQTAVTNNLVGSPATTTGTAAASSAARPASLRGAGGGGVFGLFGSGGSGNRGLLEDAFVANDSGAGAVAAAAPAAGAPIAEASIASGPDAAGAEDVSQSDCTRGTFWPFVRTAGDCPTDRELREAGD